MNDIRNYFFTQLLSKKQSGCHIFRACHHPENTHGNYTNTYKISGSWTVFSAQMDKNILKEFNEKRQTFCISHDI